MASKLAEANAEVKRLEDELRSATTSSGATAEAAAKARRAALEAEVERLEEEKTSAEARARALMGRDAYRPESLERLVRERAAEASSARIVELEAQISRLQADKTGRVG